MRRTTKRKRTGTAYIDTEVEVDVCEHLDCVPTEDLISELNDREINSEIAKTIKSDFFPEINGLPATISDSLKLEVCLKGYMKKTIEELENFFRT